MLRVFARVMRNAAPADALIARIGGEEFAIVISMHSQMEPDSILAQLRQTRMPFDLKVTASIGSCTGTLTSENAWKAMYRCADRALFDAKASGRDRVRATGAVASAA